MCAAMRAGRASGRRRNLVLVAEGAQDLDGNPITAGEVAEVLETRARRGRPGHDPRARPARRGAQRLRPLPVHAARARRRRTAAGRRPATVPAQLVGLRGNEVVSSPLMECVAQTQAVAERIAARDFEGAMLLRGGSFQEFHQILRTIQQAAPRPTPAGRQRFRIAVVHGGGPAPGMNTALRAAVRLGLDRGYSVLAVRNGFRGLRDGSIQEMDWMDVSGLVWTGGAELGTNRWVPAEADLRPDRRAARRASHRRAADGGRVERLRRGARAAPARQRYAGAGHPDRLPADDDQQRPAGHGADHRQRHRTEQHHRRRRQDQAVGGGLPPRASSSR